MSFILSSFKEWGQGLINLIPQTLYFLFTCASTVVDLCQVLFRKIVGLDTYYIGFDQHMETKEGGEVVFEIFKSIFIEGEHEAIRISFWSIVVVSIVILFVTCLAGILRSEYTPDKEKLNSKTPVINNAIKALVSFFLIPIAVFFGLAGGSILIRAIDTASSNAVTSQAISIPGIVKWKEENNVERDDDYSKQTLKEFYSYSAISLWGGTVPVSYTPISGILFQTCCYNANRCRDSSTFYTNVIMHESTNSSTSSNFNVFNQNDSLTNCSDTIDQVFAINAKLADENHAKLDHEVSEDIIWAAWKSTGTITHFNRYNVGLVSYYYDLWKFDFLVGYIAIIYVGKLFLEITFGVAKRIFLIMGMMYFLPISLSFMPADNGTVFKGWVKKFLEIVLGAYITVCALNIYYMILPVVNSIRFFPTGAGFSAANYIISTLFCIVGVQSIKTLNSLITIAVGGDKAYNMASDGGETMTSTINGVKSGIGAARRGVLGGAALVTGGAALGLRAVGAVGKIGKFGKQIFGNHAPSTFSRNKMLKKSMYGDKKDERNAELRQVRGEAKDTARNVALDKMLREDTLRNKYNNRSDKQKNNSFDEWRNSANGKRYENSAAFTNSYHRLRKKARGSDNFASYIKANKSTYKGISSAEERNIVSKVEQRNAQANREDYQAYRASRESYGIKDGIVKFGRSIPRTLKNVPNNLASLSHRFNTRRQNIQTKGKK